MPPSKKSKKRSAEEAAEYAAKDEKEKMKDRQKRKTNVDSQRLVDSIKGLNILVLYGTKDEYPECVLENSDSQIGKSVKRWIKNSVGHQQCLFKMHNFDKKGDFVHEVKETERLHYKLDLSYGNLNAKAGIKVAEFEAAPAEFLADPRIFRPEWIPDFPKGKLFMIRKREVEMRIWIGGRRSFYQFILSTKQLHVLPPTS